MLFGYSVGELQDFEDLVFPINIGARINFNSAGLKILFREPYDKMFDDFEFGSDMSDGCPVTLSSVWLGNKYKCRHTLISAQFGKII